MGALMTKREAAIDELRNIKSAAGEDGFSLEQSNRIIELGDTVKDLDVQIKAAKRADELLDGIGKDAPDTDDTKTKSVGFAFVESKSYEDVQRGSYGGRTEIKANTDIHTVEELGNIGRTEKELPIQRETGQRTTLFSWLKPQTITEEGVKWVQETAPEGDFAIVPEGEEKPQLHFGYEPKSDTLHTAAGWFDSTVQQVRRRQQYAADINRRGIRKLVLDQERMVLSGVEATDGFNGLLNTPGIGTVTATSQDEWFEKLYEAILQAEELGDFDVDGMLMNRADWGVLRLAKNGQGDFMAGSPFAGEVAERLFNVPVIVSSRVARGTAVVGASQNAAVYTEPTVHVDVTNSDRDKFTKNIVTTRIEQDILFAGLRPAGFVKVELGTATESEPEG